MKTVYDLLRDADPLHDDRQRLVEARARLRQAVVRAAATASMPTPSHLRGSRRAALATIAVFGAGLAAVGSHFWSGGNATLEAAVRFEVRLAEEQPAPGLVRTPIAGDRVIYLHSEVVVANGDVSQSRVVPGNGPAQFWVSVELSPMGTEKMRRATANHVGRPVAILIDGVVVLAPVLRSPIDGSAVISGDFTRAYAERIANGIGLR
jgi:hypothetical protein